MRSDTELLSAIPQSKSKSVDQPSAPNLDPLGRYRTYLAQLGRADPGGRARAIPGLELDGVQFFAYQHDGLRFKLAVTRAGIVRPGAHAEDDWKGLLVAAPDASTLAARIAWLESDEPSPARGAPSSPVVALSPLQHSPAAIDPAHWALVRAPMLQKQADGGATLVAWFLESDTRVPTRWTVSARADAPVSIAQASAVDLLAAEGGEVTAARARRYLRAGSADERRWALRRIRETGDRAALGDLAALLATQATLPEIRLSVVGTLGALSDPAAIAALGLALRDDAASEVRRAAAQALGSLHEVDARRALSAASSEEKAVDVRLEIVHALMAQRLDVRAELERIANSDSDSSVRALARTYVDVLPPAQLRPPADPR